MAMHSLNVPQGTTDALARQYMEASPYPHAVFDGFVKPELLEAVLREFEHELGEDWIYYHHFNEKKRGFNKLELMGPETRRLLAEFQSAPFLGFLERLTGIRGLLADPEMDGGGFHEMKPGGFLNVHVDFLAHTTKKNWSRQVNLLLFLNKNWSDSYQGFLEMWDKDMTRCVKKIRPDFNRCVVFTTNSKSWHGVPEKIVCPEDRSRKSLALYYFKDEQKIQPIQSTNYRPRPHDSFADRLLIAADRGLLRLYSIWKRHFGVPEDRFTRFLRRLFR